MLTVAPYIALIS